MGYLRLGAHTSTAGGVHNALYEGKAIGATSVQLFTSNQKQWTGRKFTKEELSLWKKARQETAIVDIMSHDSYLINLGSPDKGILHKSRTAFSEELQRCHLLGIPLINFHPGAATTASMEECLNTIVKSLDSFAAQIEKGPTRLLLETTAGQGTSVGHKFEHLAFILQQAKVPLGVCIDTCHIFSAGYDIRTPDQWNKTLSEFDKVIGLQYLQAFHLNDSLTPFASRRDRHACLGKGFIGLPSFEFLVNSPITKHLPMFLETPEKELWQGEIASLRRMELL